MPNLDHWKNQIHISDAIVGMKQLPDNMIHCCVTSPPYYGLRDYGTAEWEGGDANCKHRKSPLASPKSTLQGYTSDNVKLAIGGMPYKDICAKCGARRIDPQFGLERTPEEYIAKMVEVFREVRRIMHPTGLLWLNMGDSYAGSWGAVSHDLKGKGKRMGFNERPPQSFVKSLGGSKPLDLLGMPFRLALALQADGWYWRSCIPWLKRNAMPESTDDRPTQAVEYIFLFAKSGTAQYWTHRDKDGVDKKPKADWRWVNQITREEVAIEPVNWKELITCPKCNGAGIIEIKKVCIWEIECPKCKGKKEVRHWKRINLWKGHNCFYDGEAVRVKAIYGENRATFLGGTDRLSKANVCGGGYAPPDKGMKRPSTGNRSRRNSDWFFESWQGLWTHEDGEPVAFIVNPKPYKKAHFATFPPQLVIPCIKAGASEKGCCPECGNPWVRVMEKKRYATRPINTQVKDDQTKMANRDHGRHCMESKTLGWRPTCSCGKKPVPCVVFDPFMGSGTVAYVAEKMGRNFVGFEINETYVKDFCAERLAQKSLNL